MEIFFTTMRARGALIAVAVDPLSSHECGNQRYPLPLVKMAFHDTKAEAGKPHMYRVTVVNTLRLKSR